MTKPRKAWNLVDLISRWTPRILQVTALLTLAGLGLMVWSLAQPTPMPVILAMSVGQGLGILAFALYGVVVLVDQFRKQRAKGVAAAKGKDAPTASDEIPTYQAGVHDGSSSVGDGAKPSHREAPP